ncbi:unnamed protein product [Rhizoctonia solani]|uniref:Uncharacterized protein n=1 Tax=Rhizoctonia solani TaxID=456999 RepID=A0A8H3AAX1_9AGAM|nr:unnamed protein product [Rhizoctonia solani]
MLSDVKNVVSTLFTGKHAPVKPSDPSMPTNAEKPTEALAAPPQSHTEEENGAGHIGVPIRGISSRGSGQGVIYTSADGRISMHSSPTAEAPPLVTPPASPRERLSRLWSKSRRSADGSAPKPAEPQPSEPAIEAPVEPESHPAPSSPTAKHTKVPLKDKFMGEFKILSGKVSRDETKVEEGKALKTGHGHSAPVPVPVPVEPEERH